MGAPTSVAGGVGLVAEPVGEWKFRIDAAQRENEALRAELAARHAAALEAEASDLEARLAAADAEIRRLRAKVNTLLTLLVEPELPGSPPV